MRAMRKHSLDLTITCLLSQDHAVAKRPARPDCAPSSKIWAGRYVDPFEFSLSSNVFFLAKGEKESSRLLTVIAKRVHFGICFAPSDVARSVRFCSIATSQYLYIRAIFYTYIYYNYCTSCNSSPKQYNADSSPAFWSYIILFNSCSVSHAVG